MRAGFVGLGNLGRPLAGRLVAAGLETTVFDRLEAPVRELVAVGARAAASPREVAAAANVVGVCVPDDDDVRAVVLGEDGLLAGAAPGTVIALHSTILPGTVLALAEPAAACEVGLLDACVTGGAERAAEGRVTYLVGGDDATLARARSFLDAASEKIIHAGALGNGARLKLALNVMTYLQWAAAYEAFTLARASGLPGEIFEEAGRANGQLTELMARFLVTHKLPAQARSNEAVQRVLRGHLKTAEKDLAWALELASEAGVELPSAAFVAKHMGRIYGVEEECS